MLARRKALVATRELCDRLALAIHCKYSGHVPRAASRAKLRLANHTFSIHRSVGSRRGHLHLDPRPLNQRELRIQEFLRTRVWSLLEHKCKNQKGCRPLREWW